VFAFNAPFLAWLEREVGDLGVEVRLDCRVTADDVAALEPDSVVVATGGALVLPDLAGLDLPHVLSGNAVRNLLVDAPRPSARIRRIVVVGDDLVALEVADHLARIHGHMTLVSAADPIAPEVGWKRRTEHMDGLDRTAVSVHAGAEVLRIEPEGVVFRPAHGTERLLPADLVLVVGHIEPDSTLYDAVVARLPGVPVHQVGDAAGLGLIRRATEDGARAGCIV
jgi:2,4-dienoyl-CoA reductase (NADPH2)